MGTYFIFLALLIIGIVPLNWWHNRAIAKQVAKTVQLAAQAQHRKLDDIHKLVNSRLSEALQTIEDLKGLLVETFPAQDPRIKQAIAKNS